MNQPSQPWREVSHPLPPAQPRIGRMRRANRMFKLSVRLMLREKRLFVLPAVCAISGLALGALITFPIAYSGQEPRTAMFLGSIIAAAPNTFVTIAAGVGTVSMVADMLGGREPSFARAWALIRLRLPQILAWSAFVWAIGSILRALEEKLPLGGRIVAWIFDIGFVFATMFAVPVIAYEGLSPMATLRRSSGVMRSRFMELLHGSVAIGCASIVIVLPGVGLLVCAVLASSSFLSALLWSIFVGWLLAAIAINTSLNFVFRTVLYTHTLGYDISRSGWSDRELQLAFKPK